MRWDGQKWIDEGRLPIVYQSRTLAEDTDGTLWAAGGSGKVLRIAVAETGMRDSKAQFIGKQEGLPSGVTSTAWALGSVWVGIDRDQNAYRWDRSAHKFVTDTHLTASKIAEIARRFGQEDDITVLTIAMGVS